MHPKETGKVEFGHARAGRVHKERGKGTLAMMLLFDPFSECRNHDWLELDVSITDLIPCFDWLKSTLCYFSNLVNLSSRHSQFW